MNKESGHIVETAVEARAGFLDRPITVVLIMSTALTMALFAANISFFRAVKWPQLSSLA